jgi:hypothetical protein
MVWVFGNSQERVSIKDLDDVIYYHQKKQYTDQEFQRSRDLQREIQLGRIIKLDYKPEVKTSLPNDMPLSTEEKQIPFINLSEIKNVVSEAIAENKSEELDFKKLITNIIPMIAETVRQEISKISVTQQVATKESIQNKSEFIDPSYIPDIKTDNMKSSINIEGEAVEGSEVSSSLELLKKLGRSI